MRVIERDGAGAVSQREVAREAGVPPSAVTYYFPTIDEMLVAALTATNDTYLARLEEFATAARPLELLAEMIAEASDTHRAHTAAEYELFVMAARRPDMREELSRWLDAIDAFLLPIVTDPVRRRGVSAAVDGLFLRTLSVGEGTDPADVLAVLENLTRTP
ncbi:TetR family transcriptional regulator [Spiractinospora alimapuensis]|nr:TetR family transcriptional regulator [Spiractinospora alimapuensis]